MQYEKVILELFSRVQVLEEKYSNLLLKYEALESKLSEIENGTNADRQEPHSAACAAAYHKLTDEMIDMCYRCGKMLHYDDGNDLQELADTIAESTGMNRSSAVIYVYAVNCMLSGTVYKRAISAKAIRRYFDFIFNDYMSHGLELAIQSVREHVAYRRDCGQNVDSIAELCDEYAARL